MKEMQLRDAKAAFSAVVDMAVDMAAATDPSQRRL